MKHRLRSISATGWLIILNVLIFAALWMTRIPIADTGLSANPGYLKLRPWTCVSYMLVHYNFWHLMVNMLWLWLFGRILENIVSYKRLITIYLLGGLAGGWFYLSAGTFGAASGILCGASASVTALMGAAVMRSPNMPIRLWLFGSIKLKWIVAAAVVMLLLGAGGGGFWAHLGGLIEGITSQLSLPKKKLKGPTPRRTRKVVKNLQRRRMDMEQLDRLLDKVRISGFDSLSKQEKNELQRLSRSLKKI